MSQVFVLDTTKQPLNPVHPGRAVVPGGRKAGTYVGKVAVRSSGSFNIVTSHGTVQGISHRFCRLSARADGYSYYQRKERVFPPAS